MQVGILALQGGYAPHQKALSALAITSRLIKTANDLKKLDALVLPGGESTTMLKMLNERQLIEPLAELVQSGKKLLCTCAGVILAAQHVEQPRQQSLGWLPVSVIRNAYGDQRHSFTTSLLFQGNPIEAMFIRAPKITQRFSTEVQVLLEHEQSPVLMEYHNILAATFHPELTQVLDIYRYWLRD